MLLPLALLAACTPAAPPKGVYRSGPNAIAHGSASGELLLWGPSGTVRRVPTPGPKDSVLLGESGPLWVVDHEVPAPPKAQPVDAAKVESAGFRMKPLLPSADDDAGQASAPDAARTSGVYVRSVVKVRRDKEPPIFVVTATGDEVGAGRFDGPKDVRQGENCKAALGLVDAGGDKLLAGVALDAATRTCAVPVVVPPIDLDGDGVLDVLIYGQNGDKGFRSWFRIVGERLEAGPEDVWESIP